MMKIKFIHCGDIHFDSPFSGLSANKASIRRDELRITFRNIVELCREKHADVLLIAGDLFEGTRISEETVTFLFSVLRKIPNTTVFISPGNHDPYMPGSVYDRVDWPENVVIFKKKSMEKISVKNLPLKVFGCAFTAPYADKNLLEGFTISEEEQNKNINIMVMHGDLPSSVSASYNPITLNSISHSKLDYLALGHIHTLLFPEKCGSTYYAFSGTPEGRGFDETDEKGVIYGEITKEDGKSKFDWEFIPCSTRMYQDLMVNVDGCATHEDAAQRIEQKIENPDNIYRISLVGTLKNAFLLNLNILQSRLEEKVFDIRFRDMTDTAVDFDELARETMLKGIFAKRMMAKIEEARKCGRAKEEKKLCDALAIGLKAFEGEVSVYDNQIN